MQREREREGGGGVEMNFFVYYNKWSDIKQVLFLL